MSTIPDQPSPACSSKCRQSTCKSCSYCKTLKCASEITETYTLLIAGLNYRTKDVNGLIESTREKLAAIEAESQERRRFSLVKKLKGPGEAQRRYEERLAEAFEALERLRRVKEKVVREEQDKAKKLWDGWTAKWET